MLRKGFVLSVNPDAHEEYENRHNPIWAELEEVLREHGVKSYSIFLHAETSQLFAYAEIEDEGRWASIAETDVCQRWWQYMADLMPSNPDGSPAVIDLKEVFRLPGS